MRLERLKGYVKLFLAHHPIYRYFQSHTIQIGGLFLCLGCTGFYSGVLTGVILIIFGMFQFNWLSLVVISTGMFLPTIFRVIQIPPFSSKKKV